MHSKVPESFGMFSFLSIPKTSPKLNRYQVLNPYLALRACYAAHFFRLIKFTLD